MSGPYKVRRHPLARSDMDRIAAWLTQTAGPERARQVRDAFLRAQTTLADLPYQGTKRDEIAPGLRTTPCGRKGVIVFTVEDSVREVRVLLLTYGGEDWLTRVSSRL